MNNNDQAKKNLENWIGYLQKIYMNNNKIKHEMKNDYCFNKALYTGKKKYGVIMELQKDLKTNETEKKFYKIMFGRD